jgi:FkbM family methyltransferase
MTLRSTTSGFFRSMLRRSGREIVPYDESHFPELHRQHLLANRGITLVLDVGANVGQTGEELREFGYAGRIVSFEPLSEPFGQLREKAAADGRWDVKQCAIGDARGELKINISGTHCSSSALPMTDRHISMVHESAYVRSEVVPLCRIDDLFGEYVSLSDKVLLKADTQGYEAAVIGGAAASLPRIDLVQLELSFVQLYEGQATHYEIMRLMDEAGFDLIGLVPMFLEPETLHFLQADALFARRDQKPSGQ